MPILQKQPIKMKPLNISVAVNRFLAATAALDKEIAVLNKSIVHALSMTTPGWDNVPQDQITIKPIGGAMTNLIFKAYKPKEYGQHSQVLVRIFGEGTDSFISRDNERRIFQLLSTQNIGIAVLGEFENGRIEKFIQGPTLTAQLIRQPLISQQIAMKMKAFHTLDVPLDKSPQIIHSTWKLLAVAKEKCLGDQFHTMPSWNQLHDDIEELTSIVNQVDSPIVLSHNDLQYGNIIIKEKSNQLVLIDFEYTSYNPRGYDIGNHFCEWAFDYHKPFDSHLGDFTKYPTKEQQIHFCKAYLGPEATSMEIEALRKEVNTYSLASHLFWGLWGYIQASQSGIEFDFYHYAECRYQAFKSKITYS